MLCHGCLSHFYPHLFLLFGHYFSRFKLNNDFEMHPGKRHFLCFISQTNTLYRMVLLPGAHPWRHTYINTGTKQLHEMQWIWRKRKKKNKLKNLRNNWKFMSFCRWKKLKKFLAKMVWTKWWCKRQLKNIMMNSLCIYAIWGLSVDTYKNIFFIKRTYNLYYSVN